MFRVLGLRKGGEYADLKETARVAAQKWVDAPACPASSASGDSETPSLGTSGGNCSQQAPAPVEMMSILHTCVDSIRDN